MVGECPSKSIFFRRSMQCAQIANWGTYTHDCTPYPCEESRKRRRGEENEEKQQESFSHARAKRKEQKQRAASSLPTRFTRIRRAIVFVSTPVCNLSTLGLWPRKGGISERGLGILQGRMRQTLCLTRIGRAEFVGEFRLSVKRLCFCLVIYNECEYIHLISI